MSAVIEEIRVPEGLVLASNRAELAAAVAALRDARSAGSSERG